MIKVGDVMMEIRGDEKKIRRGLEGLEVGYKDE